jgi:chromosome segregation ATPase
MEISNDAQQVLDPLEYLTKKFPADLKQYIALRDELAVRQGAVAAAQETIRLLAETKVTSENAKAEAAQIVAEAKDAREKAKAAKAVQDKREKDLNLFAEENTAKFAQWDDEFAAREAAVLLRENNAMERENKLAADLNSLSQRELALDARIKSFQDKVAALSA